MNVQPLKIAAVLHIIASLFVIGIFAVLWYAAAGLASVFAGSFIPGLVAMFGKPIAVFAIGFGVLEMTASIALLRDPHQVWARYTLVAVSLAQIWIFPIGTALSIYTFWALRAATQATIATVAK